MASVTPSPPSARDRSVCTTAAPATTSTASGLSDDDLARQLDPLLAPLARQLRYPLPIPEHLRGLPMPVAEGRPGSGLARASVGRAPEEESTTHVPSAAATAAAAAAARGVAERAHSSCAARVDGLQHWQERVESGLVRGWDSQYVLERMLESVSSMRAITKSVQDQSINLSHSASVLMARNARLVQVQGELQRAIQHFTHMEDLCREADDAMVTAASPRFAALFQELEAEMQFLSRNAQFKSAKVYATKLAVAQQKTAGKLMDAIKSSFTVAVRNTMSAARELQGDGSTAAVPLVADRASRSTSDGSPAALELEADSLATSLAIPGPTLATLSTTAPSLTQLPLSLNASVVDLAAPTDSARRVLQLLNDRFLLELRGNASLRRMAELRSSFTYAGAEAFGEEPLSTVEDDPMLQGMLRSYCDARVNLVSPVLRHWLTVWCNSEAGHQQQQQLLTSRSASVSTAASPGMSPQPQRATAGGGGGGVGVGGGGDPTTPKGEDVPPSRSASFAESSARSPLTGFAATVAPLDMQLPQLAEHTCALLEVALAEERHVLEEVWLRVEFVNYIFPRLVSDIAEELYRVFRARYVRVDDLDELARTVEHIQLVNLRQARDDAGVAQELSKLWVRMIQDVQERMIFRTGVRLRRVVARGGATKALVAAYVDVIAAGATDEVPLLPCVLDAVRLMRVIYPTLEFSVFSVFAEEAVKTCLELIAGLAKSLAGQSAVAPWESVLSHVAQLRHLLYLRQELARIDANITVVERSLDFGKLAQQRRLEIVQSSRESKAVVESAVQTSSLALSQAACDVVGRPLTGAVRRTPEEVSAALTEMVDRAAKAKYLLSVFLAAQHEETQLALSRAVDRRVDELNREVAELCLPAAQDAAPTAAAPCATEPAPSAPVPGAPTAPAVAALSRDLTG